MAAAATTRTKFLILSDTHDLEIEELPEYLKTQPKVDVVLHCGDLTRFGGIPSYKRALRLLGSFDAELRLVIAGNHDLSLDREYWRTHLQGGRAPAEHEQAVNVMTGDLAQEMGVTYLTEGLHSFTLMSGATLTLYCSPYQPWCGNWAFSYQRSEDRFNFDPAAGTSCIATARSVVPDSVDIMMTHGSPRGILDLHPKKNEHIGCEALLRAVKRARPLLHCFGHVHEGYGVQRAIWDDEDNNDSRAATKDVVATPSGTGDSQEFTLTPKASTLMINAAIMNGENKATNRPWIVELEL